MAAQRTPPRGKGPDGASSTPAGPIALNRLSRAAPVPVELSPGPEARQAMARELDLEALRKLGLSGRLVPEGAADWRLEARLGATVVQPCVVTLAPVTTRIDVDVVRSFRADHDEPEDDEAEMPQDDTVEPLPARLDLLAVMREALALALPDYPRAEGVALAERQFSAPGVAPMTDDDAKPLAGLAALRDRMKDDGESSGD